MNSIAERVVPADPELFARTAPRWNCVDYPGDGMHYLASHGGGCLWCSMTRAARLAEGRQQ